MSSAGKDTPKSAEFPLIKTHLSRELERTRNARTPDTVDAIGDGRNSAIDRKKWTGTVFGMATSVIWKAR